MSRETHTPTHIELIRAIETTCDQIHRLDPLRNRPAVEILTAQLEDLCSLQGEALRPLHIIETAAISPEVIDNNTVTHSTMQSFMDTRDDAFRTIQTRATQAFSDLSMIELDKGKAYDALTRAREDLTSIALLCSASLPAKTGAIT